MLSSLLPGLRELRAPLAAGYVWLLGLWLVFRPGLPPPGQASGVYRDLLDLGSWSGKAAVFAAATFAAYLLGTMSLAITHWLDTIVTPLFRRSKLQGIAWLEPKYRGRRLILRALRDAVLNKLSDRFLTDEAFRDKVLSHVSGLQDFARRAGQELPEIVAGVRGGDHRRRAMDDYLHRWHLLGTVVRLDAYVESAKEDLDYVGPRLLGREDQLYGEYDRQNAEGSLRIGLFLPLAFLVAVLALRVSPWCLPALIVPVTLLYLGSSSWAAAEQNLAVALAAERVESPTLELLKSADVEFVPFELLVLGRVVPGYSAGYPNARAPRETQGRIATVAPSKSMPKPKF
ncbi:hypothetical protein [Amycolatopsis sp. BJA-103]|uniref:hypothetical protein n=1 Tax=unclassified Amycolatopsis TaxID=2618356 RepID=UPI000C782D58|nr:hypothetical protein [Amycolatopsis sp. BJA-103]AUI59789.1 hypothetical protein BKN51_17305 [Amycolatopsis sp. BJA-103]PNE14682.1 hypothetical protein B1H26_34290 [Amycolatopsis sp. BJA-103]